MLIMRMRKTVCMYFIIPKYNIPYDVEMGCESKEEAERKINALMTLEDQDPNFPTDYQITEVA